MTALGAFDSTVSTAVHSLRTPALTAIMRAWTPLGGTIVTGALVFLVAALLWSRDRRDLSVIAVALVAGGAVVSTTLKLWAERARPLASEALIPLPSSHSFPSGHTMASLCIAVAVIVIARAMGVTGRRAFYLLAAAALYAFGVAFSRVYLGVHWASDVLASWLIGGVWSAIVVAGWRHWLRSHEGR